MPGKIKRKLPMVPNGQQDHRGVDLPRRIRHQAVAMQVFAQGVGSALLPFPWAWC